MHLFWVRRQEDTEENGIDKMFKARKDVQMRERAVLHQFWVRRQAGGGEDNGSDKMDVALSRLPTPISMLACLCNSAQKINNK